MATGRQMYTCNGANRTTRYLLGPSGRALMALHYTLWTVTRQHITYRQPSFASRRFLVQLRQQRGTICPLALESTPGSLSSLNLRIKTSDVNKTFFNIKTRSRTFHAAPNGSTY